MNVEVQQLAECDFTSYCQNTFKWKNLCASKFRIKVHPYHLHELILWPSSTKWSLVPKYLLSNVVDMELNHLHYKPIQNVNGELMCVPLLLLSKHKTDSIVFHGIISRGCLSALSKNKRRICGSP